jgi:hypothetical protein
MKVTFLLLVAISIGINGWSQAIGTSIAYQKVQRPVATIELPYSQTVAENAVVDYMAKKGFKSAHFKDFTVFRSAIMDSVDNVPGDLYFMVKPKSRQAKDVVVITLLPAKPNENILSPAGPEKTVVSDSVKIEEAKVFLNRLAPYIESHNVNVQVHNQEDEIRVAQKKMNKLLNEQGDLDKKVRNLQASLDQNKKDQLVQTQQIQANIYGNDEDKRKAQKKLNTQMSDQSSLEKKLRNVQAELDQNKADQARQQEEINKQQQVFNAIKAKQNS